MSDDLSGDMLAPSWPNLVILLLTFMYDIDILTSKLFIFILVLSRTTDKWPNKEVKIKVVKKSRNINLWSYMLHHPAFQ